MNWLGAIAPQLLTVICYHRVRAEGSQGFNGYAPVISASQAMFARQMDVLRSCYTPISLHTLVEWLDHGAALPPRPVLVTFDDGYRDNAEIAWPIMRDRGVPAVIFLATDYIGTGRAFLWDVAAFGFHSTEMQTADLPLIGRRSLATAAERETATVAWVERAKRFPGSMRAAALQDLFSSLRVPRPSDGTFQRLYMDWGDVKSLAADGVEFGAHTCSHPILSSLPVAQAAAEIENSVARLTAALGHKPLGFAYPNGSRRDFSPEHEDVVRRAQVPVAFSLEPGPTSLAEARRERTAIRRLYIGEADTLPRFLAKLAGGGRLGARMRSRRSGTGAEGAIRDPSLADSSGAASR